MTGNLRAIWDIRREEVNFTFLMSLQFFLIIATFWILKPLKKTLFIEHYADTPLEFMGITLNAAHAELLAKNLNMLVALIAMGLFLALSRRFRRYHLTAAVSAILLCCLLFSGYHLHGDTSSARWIFYVFGDLFNMLMVAGFFAFLNDSVRPDQIQRLSAPIVLGGVLGGVIGSTVFHSLVHRYEVHTWIGVTGILLCAIWFCARFAGRCCPRDLDTAASLPSSPPKSAKTSVAADCPGYFRYILSIGLIVGLYELVSTIVDYQFTVTVSRTLSGPAIGDTFASVYLIINLVSLCVQVLLTGTLMRHMGIARTVLILPVFLLLGSLGFLLMPVLLVAGFLLVSDNSLNYSIHQSSREGLYVILPEAEKYRAKGVIDILVQRVAKGVGVNLTLILSLIIPGRVLAFLSICLILIWLSASRYCGTQFNRNAGDPWDENPNPELRLLTKRRRFATLLSGTWTRTS